VLGMIGFWAASALTISLSRTLAALTSP